MKLILLVQLKNKCKYQENNHGDNRFKHHFSKNGISIYRSQDRSLRRVTETDVSGESQLSPGSSISRILFQHHF
jgi:hypothetical protein